jgi:Domain of unknown function (DUF4160)
MGISKEQLKQMSRFELADPATLDGIDEWALWLEAILHGPCYILTRAGEPILLQGKQLVERLAGLKIEIHPDEHPPPHFHVRSPQVNASFAIEDCRLIKGNAPSEAIEKIRYWHKHSKQKLIDIWNETRPTDCQVGPYRGA